MAGRRRFEWDDAKATANLARRGIPFATVEAFDFATAMIFADDRQNYGEERFAATGFVGGRLHVLVYTERADATRVISLRKANKREVKRYAEFAQAEG